MKKIFKKLWKRIKSGNLIKIIITKCPTTTYSFNTKKITEEEYNRLRNKVKIEWNKSLDDMKIK